MRLKRLDLNLVITLDALLTERSVTRAGERLYTSQTTISSALGRLRDYFNDDILTQVGRKMIPTPLGESLIAPARNMLLQAEALLNTKPIFDPTVAVRNFTIMLSDYVSTVLLLQVAADLSKNAPGITLEMLSHSAMPWKSMEQGEIDLLIMPPDYLRAEHPSELLFEDDYCCIVWNDNDLVGATITLDEFLQLGHVVARFGTYRSSRIEDWFRNNHGDRRRIELVTMGFHCVAPALVNTRRIATIQRKFAEYYVGILPIRIVKPQFELPVLPEALQWNRVADNDPGIVWMRGMLRKHSALLCSPDRLAPLTD